MMSPTPFTLTDVAAAIVAMKKLGRMTSNANIIACTIDPLQTNHSHQPIINQQQQQHHPNNHFPANVNSSSNRS
jgi:hypothetical protein